MAKLSGNVHLLSPETGRTVVFGPDDGDHEELPEWVVAAVRNPGAWEDGDVPDVPEDYEEPDDEQTGDDPAVSEAVAALAEQVERLTAQVEAEREAREQAERDAAEAREAAEAAAAAAGQRQEPTRAEELDAFTLKRLQDEVAPPLGIDGSKYRTKPPLIEEIVARENETPEQRAEREAREQAERDAAAGTPGAPQQQ